MNKKIILIITVILFLITTAVNASFGKINSNEINKIEYENENINRVLNDGEHLNFAVFVDVGGHAYRSLVEKLLDFPPWMIEIELHQASAWDSGEDGWVKTLSGDIYSADDYSTIHCNMFIGICTTQDGTYYDPIKTFKGIAIGITMC